MVLPFFDETDTHEKQSKEKASPHESKQEPFYTMPAKSIATLENFFIRKQPMRNRQPYKPRQNRRAIPQGPGNQKARLQPRPSGEMVVTQDSGYARWWLRKTA